MTTATETLQQIEQDLYGPWPTSFPVEIELGGQSYEFPIWAGEQLPDRLLAYDSETAMIQGREIPQMALATVHGDQGSNYFVHPTDLSVFIRQHQAAYWCCHNSCFDFWVTAQALGSEPQALAAWWDIVGGGRLYCTMLADCLIRLAQTDAEPIPRDLGVVAREYCGLTIDKNDPYRKRYGELIGLSAAAWQSKETGFFTYGGKDPVGTLQVAQRQIQIANELVDPYRAQLLPKAVQRFGPLTCCLQTMGAVALDYASRIGVSIDLQQTRQLHGDIETVLRSQIERLESIAGEDVFRRYGPKSKRNGYQKTPAGVVRRNAKVIKEKLQEIARLHGLKPRHNKDGLVTDSAHYWKQHADLDPFVAAYVQYREQAKLLEFFAKLDSEQIYPKYRPLVRTGRTSCSNPNLQQLPRDGRFRELIVAPPGHWLLQVDYSVLELRTLAQICLKRYGSSVLADLFRQGIDPHRYTASLLMGISLDEFNKLPSDQLKIARQRAKAINFGVPGGLGAASLVAYAKYSYGAELTIEQAKEFRHQLIHKIYPELARLLQDTAIRDIAGNLQTTETEVRQAFGNREQRLHSSRIAAGCTETPDGDQYEDNLIAHVWRCLEQLNSNPALHRDIAAQKHSSLLMRRIFFGNAVTLSGRLRGHVGFTQKANTPFSGLAADGNKLALFRLLRAGFQVCGFIHDEMLILIPDGTDYTAAVQQVQQILADAMQELCPDIPICTEFLLADRWYKGIDEQPRNPQGRIIPYRRLPSLPPKIPAEQQRRAVQWEKRHLPTNTIPF